MTRQSVAIVLHGEESSNRGGPTTRSQSLVDGLRRAGYDALVVSDLRDLPRDHSVRLAHVFNISPAGSAIDQLAFARRHGMRTVFSPIVLDESLRPLYHDAIPTILRESVLSQQVQEGFRAIGSVDLACDSRVLNAGTFTRRALSTALSLSDVVLALSERERRLFHSFGGTSDKVHLVRNGTNTAIFSRADASAFRREIGLEQFALTTGRIEPRKNQAAIAIACQSVDLPYVCIGQARDHDYFDSVKRWAPKQFVHIDRIENPAFLASAYASCLAYCLPSWTEGAPLSAIEAACTGAPLLLSKLSAEQEYFGDSAEYVHPTDIESITSFLAARRSEAALPSAQDRRANNINWNDNEAVSQTLNVYEQVLSLVGFSVHDTAIRSINSNQHELPRILQDNISFGNLQLDPEENVAKKESHTFDNSPPILELFSAFATVTPSISSPDSSVRLKTIKRHGFRRSVFTLVKQSVNAMPRPIRSTMLRAIRMTGAEFSTVVADGHRLFVPRCLRVKAVGSSVRVLLTFHEQQKYSSPELRDTSALILWARADYDKNAVMALASQAARVSMVPCFVVLSSELGTTNYVWRQAAGAACPVTVVELGSGPEPTNWHTAAADHGLSFDKPAATAQDQILRMLREFIGEGGVMSRI